MKKSQHGFSLVQTLVAVGLTGVLGLIVMKNQETTTTMKTKSSTDQVIASTSATIQKALNDRAICSESLKNKASGDPVDVLVKAEPNPADYNTFLPVGGNVIEKDVVIENTLSVKQMKIVNISGIDYLEVEFDLDPKNRKKSIGAKTVKKKFQLQLVKSGPLITTCHSETNNLIQTAANESCRALNGVMVAGKCEFMSQLVDTTPVNCGDGASYRTEVSGGKIRLACTSCTKLRKFVRWDCEKKMPGMNWINVCYYKTGCSHDSNIEYGLEFWERGGTSASGGDTGTKNNCKKKRHKCAGEP